MNGIHALTDEYVMGSLTPEETQEFETHLQDCPDCREEVAQMRQLTEQLSSGVAAVPPPSLRTSVLAAIAETPQSDAPSTAQRSVSANDDGRHLSDVSLPRASTESASVGAGSRVSIPTQSTQSPESSNVVPLRSRMNRVTALLAAAAVFAALGFGGWALQSRDTARDATAQTEQIAKLLTAEDVRTVSASFANGGSGTVVLSKAQDAAILVAADLPRLGSGKVYQAWTIKGEPASGGTFESTDDETVLELPDSALEASNVAVTVEPEGGSKQPTTDAVFNVELPRA